MFQKIIVPTLLLFSFTQCQAYEPSQPEASEFERVVKTLHDGILSQGTFQSRKELVSRITCDLKTLCPPDDKEKCHEKMREVTRTAVRNYDKLERKARSKGPDGLSEAAMKMTEDEFSDEMERITFQEGITITSILLDDDHQAQKLLDLFNKMFSLRGEIDKISDVMPATHPLVQIALGSGVYFMKEWLADLRAPDDDYYGRRYLRSNHETKEVKFEDVKCGVIHTYVGRILGDPTHAAIMGTMCVAERFALEEGDSKKSGAQKKGTKKNE